MSYQKFLEALAQLEEDQSLFESEIGQELNGIHHENIIVLGGKMAKKLKIFASGGRNFAEGLQPDFISKITEAIEEYEHLIMPPKVCGGFCPCLKPARDGPEYDKKFRATMAKMVSTLFVCQAVVIEHRGEKINMDSMHFAEYANRMNTVHSHLCAITTTGNEQAREGCRVELLASADSISKFMTLFETDTEEFKEETTRRIKFIKETFQRGNGSLDRRALVNAQSSMQEIMNSVAGVSMKKSKESISALEAFSKNLKEIRDQELASFDEMESRIRESGLSDVLARLKEDSEVVYNDASSKLRDGTKRWTTVRGHSASRPVAVYRDESYVSPLGSGPVVLPTLNPETLFNGTKLKGALHLPGKAVGSVFDAMDAGVNVLVAGGNKAATGISSGAKNAMKDVKTAVQPVEKLLGIQNGNSNTSHSTNNQNDKNKKGGVNSMLANAGNFFNPLDL